MKPAIFIPNDYQKKLAGAQATEILNTLTKCSDDTLMQAYILQIVLECFEEQYDMSIRQGMSIGQSKYRPKPVMDGG